MPRRPEPSDYYEETQVKQKTAIAMLSGGLDSSTLAYDLKEGGYLLHLLSFDYGQRHKRELRAAHGIAHRLGATHHIVTLQVENEAGMAGPLSWVLSGSSLTDARVPVPDGHYAEESMKATVVPNRNAIMLSIAYGVAVAEKADRVAFAAHAGDAGQYPDCRPEFVGLLNEALMTGNRWTRDDPTPAIMAPYLGLTKGQIALRAFDLGVPIEETWSCYKGGDIHCGRCGTCVERREAIETTGRRDPTGYLDREYWKAATEEWKKNHA